MVLCKENQVKILVHKQYFIGENVLILGDVFLQFLVWNLLKTIFSYRSCIDTLYYLFVQEIYPEMLSGIYTLDPYAWWLI